MMNVLRWTIHIVHLILTTSKHRLQGIILVGLSCSSGAALCRLFYAFLDEGTGCRPGMLQASWSYSVDSANLTLNTLPQSYQMEHMLKWWSPELIKVRVQRAK